MSPVDLFSFVIFHCQEGRAEEKGKAPLPVACEGFGGVLLITVTKNISIKSIQDLQLRCMNTKLHDRYTSLTSPCSLRVCTSLDCSREVHGFTFPFPFSYFYIICLDGLFLCGFFFKKGT